MKQVKLPRRARIAAVSGAILMLCQPSWALNYNWTTAAGEWENPANWSLLGVPGASDSAELAFGMARLSSAASLGTLYMTGGGSQIYGTGQLTVATLNHERGTLGGNSFTGLEAGSTIVTTMANFNGALTQSIGTNHVLTLHGLSNWTAGNGSLGGSGTVVNTAGASFNDLGTGNANAYKALLDVGGSYNGGRFINQGSFVRNGQGLTRAYGFENSGTLQVLAGTFEMRNTGQLAGQTEVASGATLAFYSSQASITGTVANAGLMRFDNGSVSFASGAILGGALEVVDGRINNQSTNTVQSLALTGGGSQVYGTGHLNVGSLNHARGTLGGNSLTGVEAGSTTVTGAATFNGAMTQSIGANHVLTLQGPSAWSAGSGSLGGSGTVVNAAAATFTDQGAGHINAYKSLLDVAGSYDGGSFVNQGTFIRSGLGTTRAYGFNNQGTLLIEAGRLRVNSNFSNTGTVSIAAGTVLESGSTVFTNDGLMQGTGTIRTLSANDRLSNAGTIDPGAPGALGTLTVEGDLAFTENGMLRIDLGTNGSSDLVAITSDVIWSGTLSVWAQPGLTLHGGEFYTIATFGQRLNASTFSSISWHGLDGQRFAVEYNAHDITLRVSAVPEPASGAMLSGGLAALGLALRRRNRRATPSTRQYPSLSAEH